MTGQIEDLDLPSASYDVIVMMDVLEHLPDPMKTMLHCMALLKPNGFLMIQTPESKENMQYMTLVETNSRFLEQLKFDEHLYLFSKKSVALFFNQLGAPNIQFEPAIFSHYDMFCIVSKQAIQPHTVEESEAALLATSAGRIALALLDLREREQRLLQQSDILQFDSAARLEQSEILTTQLNQSEADRFSHLKQIKTLTHQLKGSESDRAARFQQIEILTKQLSEAESDRAARFEQNKKLALYIKELEVKWKFHLKQVEILTSQLSESERVRRVRYDRIALLVSQLNEAELVCLNQSQQIEKLNEKLKESEFSRISCLKYITILTARLKEAERTIVQRIWRKLRR